MERFAVVADAREKDVVFDFKSLDGKFGAEEPAGLPGVRLQYGEPLAALTEVEAQLYRRRLQGKALFQHTLREWVADAIGVGVLHISAHTIGAGMNGFALEWVTFELKAVSRRIESCVRGQVKPCRVPEQFLEAVARVPGFKAHFLDYFLVEVIEELFLSNGLGLGDFGFKFLLELVKLKYDLLGSPASLIDADYALLKIHARLNCANYFI